MLVVAGVMAALSTLGSAQQDVERVTLKFADASRPGKLKVHLMNGAITVKGSNRSDVLIEARQRDVSAREGRGVGRGFGAGFGAANGRGGRGAEADTTSTAGLRKLTPSGSGFTAEQENNEIVIAGTPFGAVDLDIQVPMRTNLQIGTFEGAITVDGVEGEHEVSSANGGITMTKVAGAVVAHSMGGNMVATLTRVLPDKPMAFTSMSGKVDVTLPASVKATFKLRSDMADVFTDFDLQMQPRRAQSSGDSQRDGKYRIEVNRDILGTANGGGPEFELRTFSGNVYLRKGQ